MDAQSLSWFKKAKKENISIEYKSEAKDTDALKNTGQNTFFNPLTPPYLYLKFTKEKGFGVFTKKKIKKEEIIEACYGVVLNWRQRYQHDPSIYQYTYWHQCPCDDCNKHGPVGIIPLGYGCIYNSADSNESKNARFIINANNKSVTFIAEKDINEDEEILTWWGEDYYNNWCKPKNQNT